MNAAKPVTTRRTIKPGAVSQPPATAVPARADSAPSPLWQSWFVRFVELDRVLIAADARERNGWHHAPLTPNPAEMQRIQDRFLRPWDGLIETFAVAVIASPLGAAQQQALQSYLDLRAAFYRAAMRRFLVPGEASLRQYNELRDRLDAAVAARG